MALPTKLFFTLEQYFDFEQKATDKHEYFEGQMWAMAGGSPDHAFIAANCITALNIALRNKTCRVFGSDLRVAVKKKGFYTYPDITVVCGKIERLEGRDDTITNPKLIVEVLSPSTEKYDRSGKFELYKPLQSLETYILVDSKSIYVSVYQRGPGRRWSVEAYEDLTEVFKTESLGIEIALSNIYDGAEFLTEQSPLLSDNSGATTQSSVGDGRIQTHGSV